MNSSIIKINQPFIENIGKYVHKFGGSLFLVCLLFTLTIIHANQKSVLVLTGDEPRFVYYSYSIAEGEMLKYPIESFLKETGSIRPAHTIADTPITLSMNNKTMFMMNSIIAPLLHTPALFFGPADKSVELLRSAAFFYYCGSLIFIWLSLKTIFSIKESMLAISITTLSLPQLAQMSLGTTEQVATFFIASALYFLIFRKTSFFTVMLGAISMCLLVYSSMRCIPIAGFIALGFLARIWVIPKEIRIDQRFRLFLFIVISVLGTIGWVVMQISFTGTISGSSAITGTITDKPPIWFIHRLFAPLLNHRDGIFLLFPLVFASFLGLLNAARKRNIVGLTCLGGWLSYYFLISLTSQNEGYPGRLQFVLIEIFAVGLAFFIRDFRGFASVGILLQGVTISWIVAYTHLIAPAILVQNREYGLFQQMLLHKSEMLDFGRYLIWDKNSSVVLPDTSLFLSDAWSIAYRILFFLVVLGVLLFQSKQNRCSVKIRNLCSFSALIFSFLGTASLLVTPVPMQDISIDRTRIDQRGSVKLTFAEPIEERVTITFGAHAFWHPPEYPSHFEVDVELDNGEFVQYKKRSMPEIRLALPSKSKSIAITGDESNVSWNAYSPKVYTAWW